MDLHGARGVAVSTSGSCVLARRRSSLSRSVSHTSEEPYSGHRPLSIPGKHVEHAPPPLPPPRYIEDLDQGHDIVQEREHYHLQPGDLPPIKEGSSLLSGIFSQPKPLTNSGRSNGNVEGGDGAAAGASTVKSDSGCTIPSVVRRPPSPSSANNMLHGERPLAQQNLHRSNHLYDRDILSKIGKANSPPRHLRAGSADSPVTAQKLSIHTKDVKAHLYQQLTPVDTAPMSELSSRFVTSPVSGGPSPLARNWRDHNTSPRSPSTDSGTIPMALDPELFVAKHPIRSLTVEHIAASEDLPIRSGRNSYDQSLHTPTSESMEDASIFSGRNFRTDETGTDEGVSRSSNMQQGVKRKSPPGDGLSEERYRSDFTSRLNITTPYPHPPGVAQLLSHGSLSSMASSLQQSSVASSSLLSAAPSSLTSISSYDAQPPKDMAQTPSQTTSAGSGISSAVGAANRKTTERIVPRKMPGQQPPEIRPAPARIGNHFICACCPKKPKKFETEERLRIHENEKQYACNYCHNRFKNKNEAERHQNSLHLRKHSWSCAALDKYEAAFNSSGAIDSTSGNRDACGYCGEEFANLPAPDWHHRIDHLTNAHKFGECNSTKKFFRADHFRQHLKHSHAGRSGKWTNILEQACVRDEPVPDSGFSISTGENHQTPVMRPGHSILPMS